MNELPRIFAFVAFLLVGGGIARAEVSAPLTIYFIDVEGGQSTLVVTPERHSLLIDTGWAGQGKGFSPGDPHEARDANRIMAAAKDAGITRIDYLLITHFHPDHDGGIAELGKLTPVGTFIDHERPSKWARFTSPDIEPAYKAYLAQRQGHEHIVPKPGDALPIPGVEVTVVSSAARILTKPLPGGGVPVPLCGTTRTVRAGDPFENPRSTGILLQFGRFRFLDVGDLTGKPLRGLACPKSLVGPVSVYLVAHHGGIDAFDLATFAAFSPEVAIMNNGLKKGGGAATFHALHHVAGLKDAWQLHLSSNTAENFPAAFVANLDEVSSYWIKLQAQSNGAFRIQNPRTGTWTSYAPREASSTETPAAAHGR
jgi:competence protein ComEC